MILLSLNTTAKYILTLLLAVFGYIPFDQVEPLNKDSEENSEKKLTSPVADSEKQLNTDMCFSSDSYWYSPFYLNRIDEEIILIMQHSGDKAEIRMSENYYPGPLGTNTYLPECENFYLPVNNIFDENCYRSKILLKVNVKKTPSRQFIERQKMIINYSI